MFGSLTINPRKCGASKERAMKIIKRGKKPKKPAWTKKFKCGECGAILLIEKKDIYLGSTEYCPAFRCPCCDVEHKARFLPVPFEVTQYYYEWKLKNKKKDK